MSPFLRVSSEVARALSSGVLASKVVLLESAILTHGLPRPHNLQMARTVQRIIRDEVRPS